MRTSVVTFEEQPTSAAEFQRRLEQVESRTLPWLVTEDGDTLTGLAHATPYGALLEALGPLDLHAAIAAITLPNPRSIALHERLGFRKVGHLEQVGFKLGRWIDVGYWQLTF